MSVWFVMGVVLGISVGVTLVNWLDFVSSTYYAEGTTTTKEGYHGNEDGGDGA